MTQKSSGNTKHWTNFKFASIGSRQFLAKNTFSFPKNKSNCLCMKHLCDTRIIFEHQHLTHGSCQH